MLELNKIHLGKNIDVLKTFPDNSIDSVVTDPPYGLGKEPNVYEVMKSWIETGYHEIKGKGFMGKEWDSFVPQPIFWKEVYRVLKPGGFVLSFAGTRTYDWMVMAIRFAGFEVRDMIGWLYGSGFPKSLNISLSIDKKLGHADRGHRISVASRHHPDGTFEPNGEDLPKYEGKEDISKQWQGYGTALKPAHEPIVLARKPLDGTVAENVLKWGCGGLNIDECRVETNDFDGKTFTMPNHNQKDGTQGIYNFKINAERLDYEQNTLGRFPANIIHDGSDEVVKLFPNSGEESEARFFYTTKTSQSERNAGLYGFEEETVDDGREKTADNAFQRGATLRKNIHPTVKPIDLMRYLVRLVTPPNGLCLDPYLGSGTTAIACKLEGFNYIGIEMEEQYHKIAESRVANCEKDNSVIDGLLKNENVKEVFDIFDFIGSD